MSWGQRVRWHYDYPGYAATYPWMISRICDAVEREGDAYYMCFRERDWEKINTRLFRATATLRVSSNLSQGS